MELTLPARQPFSLPTVIHSHGWIRLAPFEEIQDLVGFSYIDQLESGKVIELHIQEAPGGVLVSYSGSLNQTDHSEIARKIFWMLGLDQDFSTFYNLAQKEPRLAQVPGRAQGRVLRSPTLFEDVVKTICTINTAWSGTIRMVNNLVNLFGASLPADESRRAFPLPASIAASDEATLRSQAKLGFRAPYVLELSRKVAAGDLDLEALKAADIPTSQLRQRLLEIKGVGDYAVANLLMLLGHYDYIPVDTWAVKMVSNEFYNGEPVNRTQVEAAFESWGEWKGLAYWFWDWNNA